MAVDIDTSSALRGINDLRRLVGAVVGADEHDEPDWLEWKSTLDLASKEGCFHIARAVLGMANRLPRAGLTCEGLGYVVVGAEPGNAPGIVSVDPATLDAIIDPYLGGSDGPRWTPTYVAVETITILVVTVESPKQGDKIFSLRREFDKGKSGAVFVRKHGRTVPADASDLDALQARLMATSPVGELEVTLTGDVPISWIATATVGDAIGRWVAEQEEQQVAAARETERLRQAPKPKRVFDASLGGAGALAGFGDLVSQHSLAQAAGLLGEADKRTLEEYLAQVDDWVRALTEAASGVFLGRYFDAGHGVVAVSVHNPTGRFLSDVEVEIHFEGDHVGGLKEKPKLLELPRPPRIYGKRKPAPSLLGPSTLLERSMLLPHFREALLPIRQRTWVEDGYVRIRFQPGDLRQHGTDASGDVYLVIRARPDDGILRGTWKATIRDQEGVLTGTLEVPIADEPVDIATTLNVAADDVGGGVPES